MPNFVAMMSEFGCASADLESANRLPLDPVLRSGVDHVGPRN